MLYIPLDNDTRICIETSCSHNKEVVINKTSSLFLHLQLLKCHSKKPESVSYKKVSTSIPNLTKYLATIT